MSDQMKADRATPLPCPFCGKQPVLQRCMEEYEADDKFPAGEYEAGVLIICTECGIEMGDEYRSEVVERWNTRAALMQQAADEAAHGDLYDAWMLKRGISTERSEMKDTIANLTAQLAAAEKKLVMTVPILTEIIENYGAMEDGNGDSCPTVMKARTALRILTKEPTK